MTKKKLLISILIIIDLLLLLAACDIAENIKNPNVKELVKEIETIDGVQKVEASNRRGLSIRIQYGHRTH